MNNLRNFIESIRENGGASYNFSNGEFNPTNGYFVSIVGMEKVIDIKNVIDCWEVFIVKGRKILKEYIAENLEMLDKENVFLGAWIHEGKLYLDCSQKIDSLSDAVTKGMQRDQLAIFDAAKGKEITLPTRQKCGTEFQKQTYIHLKTQQICENY